MVFIAVYYFIVILLATLMLASKFTQENKGLGYPSVQDSKGECPANDTLDLSQLSMDELKKTIDVPKEIRGNQAATIMYQMDEVRKLVSLINRKS